ncbi:MAG TPA: zinc ribbon domain-containing protein [Candidatus Hypogeohydataceae bacterium YC41]
MALEVTNKGTLADKIGVLRHLQSVDSRLIELTRKKENLREALEKKKAQLHQTKGLLSQRQKEAKDFQKLIDSKELDLKCLEEEIKKTRGRLFQIKNNKEYSALLSEIGSKEADKSVLEDETLSMMSKFEGLHAEEKQLAQKVQEEEKDLTVYASSVETELKSLEKDIQAAKKQWEESAELLNKEALALYRRLIEKDGLAVVDVNGDVCGGCNMSLTPQTINLLLRRQEVILCKSCGRILCLPVE